MGQCAAKGGCYPPFDWDTDSNPLPSPDPARVPREATPQLLWKTPKGAVAEMDVDSLAHGIVSRRIVRHSMWRRDMNNTRNNTPPPFPMPWYSAPPPIYMRRVPSSKGDHVCHPEVPTGILFQP